MALLELDAEGAPRPAGGRVVLAPDPDGRFGFVLPEWTFDASVLLVGRASNLRPAVLVLRPDQGAPPHDVVLALTDGAELRGLGDT